MRFFFALVGDYESLIMLMDEPPVEDFPSMNAESISLFVDFKFFEPGTVVVGHEYEGEESEEVVEEIEDEEEEESNEL